MKDKEGNIMMMKNVQRENNVEKVKILMMKRISHSRREYKADDGDIKADSERTSIWIIKK